MSKPIEKMSLEELKSHQKEVAATIVGYEKTRRTECLKEMKAVAKKYGFSFDEFVGGKASKSTGPLGVAKYANPDDSSQTWTGRGRQPNWVKSAMAEGKTLADMAI